MRERIKLNEGWRYGREFREEMLEPGYDEAGMEAVRLPHTNVVTPFHYFDEQIYQFVSCYRRALYAEEAWREKTVLLTFEAVGHIAEVYVNHSLAGRHEGGYTAFTVDIGPYLVWGKENIIAVKADSRESNNLPPFGNVIDYLTYGGIYREVFLEICEKIGIEDVFIMTGDSPAGLPEGDTREVKLQITLRGDSDFGEADEQTGGRQMGGQRLRYSVMDALGKVIYDGSELLTRSEARLSFPVRGVRDWEPGRPELYYLKVGLYREEREGILLDRKTVRFGFRTCEFREDGFYLNHKKIKLVGLNRHQSFPYVGYAMPKRQQRRDAEILKYELGVNAVRTSHYPQSRHFIEACDELGLLVFTELPGWQHIGDEEWKKIAVRQVYEMIMQYRNHPSIILWGVRINESQDDDEFYARTNRLAHELDPGRQTGGVRYLMKSRLLEDVYTYNDFLHNGDNRGLSPKREVTPEPEAPYLVSEFNGHMYPAKSFDDEDHRLEHALRHARVLEDLFGQEDVAGGFGWCMFDYNTHKEFGSGDHICHHGVMDMFRNAKLAASVYASQGEETEVFELSSSLDIGDHPGGNIKRVYAFTNADFVRMYKNETFIREFYPAKSRYPHLPHPPVRIDDFIGELLEKEEHYSHRTAEAMKEILLAVQEHGPNNLPLRHKLKMGWLMLREHLTMEDGARLYYKYVGNWGGQASVIRFEAIRGGRAVKTIMKKPASQPRLQVSADTTQLMEDGTYDVAAVRLRAADEWGNLLPYCQLAITLKAEGAIEIIGPSVISLQGGMGGTYVKTKGRPGKGRLFISQPQLGDREMEFTVEIAADSAEPGRLQ
ncbi:beta-galactosidase [Anaerotaenia torta]|uniref:glycoside hydrolase family 2 protein n=1 Tax=Anaerotaenia torta TaxID=433293 RepID=UPI003D1F1A57